MRRYRLYGITLETDFPFSWPLMETDTPVDVRFTCEETAPVAVDWARAPAVHEVAISGDEDRPDITYHVVDGLDVVRIRGVADHYVWADRIICHVHQEHLGYLVEIQLLGMVLAMWLERRGLPTLHASVVVVGGSAVAFLGAKGGGKTTAATALIAAGHRLLVDDLLTVQVASDGSAWAESGYPMLRLWPEQVRGLLGLVPEDLPLVHPAFEKRRVDVHDHLGRFHDVSAPLRRVFLPARKPEGAPEIEPLGSGSALLALVNGSFLGRAIHGLGLSGPRLASLARIAESVEVAVLRIPDGFDHLGQLVETVEREVAT